MSELKFEHEEGDTPFGIFHPTGYIVASYADNQVAKDAADAVAKTGIQADKVSSVSGQQVQAAIENAHPPQGLLEGLKATLAKTAGMEGHYWDQDLKQAKQGAGFVTVYCGDGERAHKVADALRPLAPLSMRRYRSFAIEDLLQSATPGKAQ